MRERKPLRFIEKEIRIAVRHADGCAGFTGAVVQYKPAQDGEANWDVLFVHYGTALHRECDQALAEVVRELKAKFDVSTDLPIPS